MKKKSLALIAIAVMMVASIATAATLAFFTDTQSKDNKFIVVGDVKIGLTETNWDGKDKDGKDIPDTDTTKLGQNQKLVPNVAIAKNPVVINAGKNEAYARMKVTINYTDLFTKSAPNEMLGTLGANWTLDATATTTDTTAKTVTYVYNYGTKIAKDAATPAVFTEVKLPGYFTNTEMQTLGDKFKITVTAEAIQADGFNDATAALAALTTQLKP